MSTLSKLLLTLSRKASVEGFVQSFCHKRDMSRVLRWICKVRQAFQGRLEYALDRASEAVTLRQWAILSVSRIDYVYIDSHLPDERTNAELQYYLLARLHYPVPSL